MNHAVDEKDGTNGSWRFIRPEFELPLEQIVYNWSMFGIGLKLRSTCLVLSWAAGAALGCLGECQTVVRSTYSIGFETHWCHPFGRLVHVLHFLWDIVGITYVKPIGMNGITALVDEFYQSIAVRHEDKNEHTLGRMGKHSVAIMRPGGP
jgi:hypothetical protein